MAAFNPIMWRKSSRSQANGNCVEVAYSHPAINVRDSKDPSGPWLTIPQGAWHTFLGSVKEGEFDR